MCAESRSHQMTETKTYEFSIVLLSFQGIRIEAANEDTIFFSLYNFCLIDIEIILRNCECD